MLSKNHTAIPAQESFAQFQKVKQVADATLVPFLGVEGYDVYNPSVPFNENGRSLIAGRVEQRGGHASQAMFFAWDGSAYRRAEDLPVFDLEDPFITFIGGEMVFGGVEVQWKDDQPAGLKTVFYRGQTVAELSRFAEGPKNMKDIRFCGLPDGRVAVFTRPRDFAKLEEWGSLARIGFVVLDSLDALAPEPLAAAETLPGMFTGFEWGGANQALMLENGLVGVVGHRSWGRYTSIEDCDLHYYGIAFAINPQTRETTKTKIIISRDCFPAAAPKIPGLADVTFTAGIERQPGGTALVYTGLSDAAVGRACIPDPFSEWERL